MFKRNLIIYAYSILILTGCNNRDDDYTLVPNEPDSPVVVELDQIPYPKLSEYHFFEGEMKSLIPSPGVLPFQPISELFTDYASKKRMVWMPKNTKASYNSDHTVLEIPVGGVLIKNFYYDLVLPENLPKIIETRLMIRKADGWIFANYVWNEEQTEAYLNTEGETIALEWIQHDGTIKSTLYSVPSTADCMQCHASLNGEVQPIGIKPQNLNKPFNYIQGSKNQLSKWIEVGYLDPSGIPTEIYTTVDYKNLSESLSERARSYLDINCAHCHRDNGTAEFYHMRFSYHLTTQATHLGICIHPNHEIEGFTGRIITPGIPEQSMLHYRMNTVDPELQMPPVGRSLIHEEGLLLIEEWIQSIQRCD